MKKHFTVISIVAAMLAIVYFYRYKIEYYPNIQRGDTKHSIELKYGMGSIVNQTDGGENFLYWPNKGFAVFFHPLYRRQHEAVDKEQWVVTDVFIPTQNKVEPKDFPVDSVLSFDKLLDVSKLSYGSDVKIQIQKDNSGRNEAIIMRFEDNSSDYD